jgi:hypothetical protein
MRSGLRSSTQRPFGSSDDPSSWVLNLIVSGDSFENCSNLVGLPLPPSPAIPSEVGVTFLEVGYRVTLLQWTETPVDTIPACGLETPDGESICLFSRGLSASTCRRGSHWSK